MDVKVKRFEIFRKVVSLEQLDVWNINTDDGTLILKPDNPKIDYILKVIMKNKICIFDCVRENKKFVIIDTHPNKLIGLEATVIKIEKEPYTGNIHVTTDPYRRLILPKRYTGYDKICHKLRINMTCLFLLTADFSQLLDVKNLLNHTSCIKVLDVINIDNNCYEIVCKDIYDKRFIHNSFLNIGSVYKIKYTKAPESNFYNITDCELLI